MYAWVCQSDYYLLENKILLGKNMKDNRYNQNGLYCNLGFLNWLLDLFWIVISLFFRDCLIFNSSFSSSLWVIFSDNLVFCSLSSCNIWIWNWTTVFCWYRLTCIYASCKIEENHVSAEELGKGIQQDHQMILNNEIVVLQARLYFIFSFCLFIIWHYPCPEYFWISYVSRVWDLILLFMHLIGQLKALLTIWWWVQAFHVHMCFTCSFGLAKLALFFFQILQSLILHLCNAFFFVSCLLSINIVMYFLFSRVFLQEFFQPTNGELQKWKVKWEARALSFHGCLLSLCLHKHVYSTRVSSNFYLYYILVEYA